MSEMVERVREAVRRTAQQWGDSSLANPQADGDYLGALARAAIEAMREPTTQMAIAGDAAYMRSNNGEDLNDAYRAMISAALSPEEGVTSREIGAE